MFKGMVRTKSFWSVLVAASLVSAVVGSKYLFKVLPMISVDVKMNREQALEKTATLAKNNNWAPQDCWQTAHFQQDHVTQFFAELECGGITAFQTMIEDKLYEPYQWHVRNFKESVTQETHIFFTAQGEPYGFEVKLAEDETPGNLGITEARKLALQLAQKDWNVSFDDYKEVETSKEETPKGRIDHTFLYERTNATLGKEGKYRIKLVVSGNVFAQLKQFVQAPEGFMRRYEAMRSKNNIFASSFGMLFKVLFLLLGGLIGGFILIRKRRYLLIPAAAAVGILSFFALLNTFNNLPLAWMNYNTAQSSSSFMVSLITMSLFGVLQNFIAFLLVVGAGESLGRWAFPNHVQFWKSWSKKTGGTLTVLGQTLGGYALFCFELPLMAALYYALTQGLGWWAPTGTLINPNILATYAPWLGAFSNSLSAGFWEEFAFRALPIAGMIVLGRYFKQEKLFLIIAMIAQAIIFGGMHTFYAQQPVYFRIVELLIPSLLWAAVYLAFGLLPGIICHYLWDLMWFSFPIMASNASGALPQKIIIILTALLPLLIVLFRRWQIGKWEYASKSSKNSAWKVPAETIEEAGPVKTVTSTLSDYKLKLILGAGVLGLAACLFFGKERNTNPPLTLSKEQAIVAAKEAVNALPDTDKNWTIVAQADNGVTPQQLRNYTHIHRFVWRTQLRKIYKKLLGTYLTTVHWKTRFMLFEGDIAERAEEYICFINTKGEVYRIWHILPEAQKGKSLSEGEARGIALSTVKEHFGLSTDQLKEISAIDIKKPERKDWNFIFQDTTHKLKDGGQTRINIVIGGDKIVDYERFIFVPEAWTRAETLREGVLSSFGMISMLFLVLLIMLSVGTTAKTSFEGFKFSRFLVFFGTVLAISGISVINKIPLFSFTFSSAQPFNNQLFSILTSLFGSVLLQGFGLAFLLIGFRAYCMQTHYKKTTLLPLVGFALALIIAGISSCCDAFLPQLSPKVADLTGLSTSSVLVNIFIFGSFYLFLLIALFVPVSICLTTVTNYWKKRNIVGFILCVATGIALTAMGGPESLIACFVIGIPMGIGFYAIHRYVLMYDPSLFVPFFAGSLALEMLQNGLLYGYPTALTNTLIGIVCTFAIGIFWFKKIR